MLGLRFLLSVPGEFATVAVLVVLVGKADADMTECVAEGWMIIAVDVADVRTMVGGGAGLGVFWARVCRINVDCGG